MRLMTFAIVLWMRQFKYQLIYRYEICEACDILHIKKRNILLKNMFFKNMIFLYGMQIYLFTKKTSYLSLFQKKPVNFPQKSFYLVLF